MVRMNGMLSLSTHFFGHITITFYVSPFLPVERRPQVIVWRANPGNRIKCPEQYLVHTCGRMRVFFGGSQ